MKSKLYTLVVSFIIICQLPLMGQFNGKPIYDIMTKQLGDTLGTIRVELFPSIAPRHVANFDSIVQANGYDSTAFHRVIPDFMIQGGDPNSISGDESTWGMGDPSQANVPAEFNAISHIRGIMSAARSSDPNSATSQFFICVAASTHLDGNYSAYGRVLSGMDVADVIVNVPTNANDLPNDKISMFVSYVGLDSTLPQKPQLVSPADNEIDITIDSVFEWHCTDSAQIAINTLQISTTSNFSDVILEEEISYNYNALQLDSIPQGFQNYFWRVCANNGYETTCSDARSITTFIEAPGLIFPEDNQSFTSTIPNLRWETISNAESYHLQVSKHPSFNYSNLMVVDTIIDSDTFLMDTLETQRTYYWRVASVYNSKIGQYSEERQFTTTPNTGINDQLTTSLSLYPNPSRQFIVVGHQLAKTKYTVFDLTGKEVLHGRVQKDGKINLESLPSGRYFIEVTKKGSVHSAKFIKQ